MGLSYANQHTTTYKFSQILLWLIQQKIELSSKEQMQSFSYVM